MNKICPRSPVVLTASMLAAIFLAFSPASAFAYTCTANILTPSVKLGDSAKVRVDISGAAEPVYVFARAQQGWSSLPLMPLYPIVQSIDGCVKDASFALLGGDSCRDNSLYTKVSAPGGSVTINALTNTIHTALGAQSFNIFCSTNKPLANYSQDPANTDPNRAWNVQPLTASYTVTSGATPASGGADCRLNFPDAAIVQDPSELQTTSLPGFTTSWSMAKDATAVHSVINTGTSPATVAIETIPPAIPGPAISRSDGLTLNLGPGTLTGGATTLLAITLNKFTNGGNLVFYVTSSCGATKHTYVLSVSSPSTPPGVVGPPPQKTIDTPYHNGDFPIVMTGGDVIITEGQTITRDVTVGNPKGYTSSINMSGATRADLPPGINLTFNPAEGIISTGESFHTKVTFRADGLALAGTYKYFLGVTLPIDGNIYRAPQQTINTKFSMVVKNKVIPAKDAASMPATINTLRTYEAKMLNIRVETPGQTDYPCHPYACLNEYPSTVGTTFMAVKSWVNPVMILDKAHFTTDMGARYYSLADPMNPTHDSSKDLTLDNRWAGDFGPQMYPVSLAYSRDGGYEVGSQWNQGNRGSTPEYRTNGADTGIPFEGDYHGDPVDIFQSNSHVYFTYMYRGGVTRLDGIKKSAPYFNSGGASVQDWIYPELPDTAPNIPKSAATQLVNATVMAGAKDYVAALVIPVVGDVRQPGSSYVANKLSIYSPTENDPVAEIEIKNATTTFGGVQNMTSFVTSDVQYVMFTALQYLKSSPLSVSDPKRWENLLYVYKFNPKTSTLTKVAEGIKIAGEIGGGLTRQSLAGIRVGNKDGVIMLLHDDLAKDDPNPNPSYGPQPFQKLKIFMFSDLAAGNLKDVYKDAGYSISTRGPEGSGGAAAMIASLNVGVSTYVYLNTQGTNPTKGIAVLRFGPSGVNVPPVTPSTPTHLACVSNACTSVSVAGADSCTSDADCTTTTPGSGNPPGPEPTAGFCDFTLTPNPASINKTVAQGQSSYISFGLSTTKPVDTTCPAITLSLSTVRDTAGNTVATPLSTSLTISPGNSTVAIYNVSKFPGSYTLPIKAYGRGVQKIIDLELIVQ